MAFCPRYGDVNFIAGQGVNTPTACSGTVHRVLEAGRTAGREVGIYVGVMVVAAETSEEAVARWSYYQSGADLEALRNIAVQSSLDPRGSESGSSVQLVAQAMDKQRASMVSGVLVGSYGEVAGMLDEIASIQGVTGALLIFDDYLPALETFGAKFNHQ